MRLALDVLNGVPSIVIGIFVFTLLVAGTGQAAWQASFALAMIMLPLVSRATMEVLTRAGLLREAASHSASRSGARSVRDPPDRPRRILTGSTLAVARAAGETAPLLFTSSIFPNAVVTDPSQAMATLPFTIFVYSEAPDPHLNDQAWAAASSSWPSCSCSNLLARFLLARSERKLKGR